MSKITIRKKSSSFWDFPYIFLNKSGLMGPIFYKKWLKITTVEPLKADTLWGIEKCPP